LGGPNQIADTVVGPLKPIRNKNVMDKEFNTIPASEDFLRTMIDKIPTLAWSCWPDGTTEFLNQRWLDYTGLSMEEALGWGWKAVIHSEDLENLMATWLGLLASGEHRRVRPELICA
jgi:PAS domain S-box-containing protein